MTRSDYFWPVRGGISGLCEEADDNPLSNGWTNYCNLGLLSCKGYIPYSRLFSTGFNFRSPTAVRKLNPRKFEPYQKF